MKNEPSEQKSSGRVAIIEAVNPHLGFYVLLVLVVEVVLGALAAKTTGNIRMIIVCGMLFIVVTLILVVSFFAYRRDDFLLGPIYAVQPRSRLD